jgi:hypothetical protein
MGFKPDLRHINRSQGRARACRRNHQVPRVPLPDVGVTFIRETCTASSENITPLDSSGTPIMGLAVPHLERLAPGAGHRPPRNGRGLASQGLSSFLNLEGAARPAGTTCHFP